jgi:hypothetical protein
MNGQTAMNKTLMFAALALAALLTGCVAPQRFQAPLQPQVQATPQQPRADQHRVTWAGHILGNGKIGSSEDGHEASR